VLPVCQRFGMGVTAWSPLSKGMLTGKYRRGQKTPDTLRAKYFPKAMSDERSLDIVEQLLPVAADAGLSLTHMALAFVVAHPSITAAIMDPRTMEQFDDLLRALEAKLDDATMDRIDAIVPPGVDVAPLEGSAYVPPAIQLLTLRRRPINERSVA
jgi:aryl-alcohol dehydrogenase-like predicted oxidoreductase